MQENNVTIKNIGIFSPKYCRIHSTSVILEEFDNRDAQVV
jgi:hypothetical protein